MQITINEVEILTAIETFVRSQIAVSENQKITIDLKAGRGENGYSATLDIVPADLIAEATVAPTAAPRATITETPEDRKEPAEAASKTAKKSAFTLKDEEPEDENEVAKEETKPAPKANTIFSKVAG